ncbi:F0F1 ATP synthase subunit A [Sphaerisporangium sp. TRM90804]|uniref:F0F1 ATP synthase subunit A n=1 Tax=Sphaerisporangium sp. TRM90804 TaxID=3031113 RepID=UPI00244D4790|nr:F0F1 ATP synthase subunit A [Sphaerisporangium sp. TRM90804]MDH2428315.1 F0F1 ATP synthase subunit A [Sphaerisporangium sp. TRM90804]
MRTTILITSPDTFQAPGLELFDVAPIFPGGPQWLTKPVLIALLGSVIVIGLVWAAFARPKLVPRGWQGVGELAYVFVREQVARPTLGKDADRWMGFLFSVFLIVLVWNLMGVIPVIQFPVAARISFPLVLAISVYVLKLYLGVRHHGVVGYLKGIVHLPGLPGWAYALYAPLILAEVFINSLFTHFVRLFANMFAGHLILAFFSSVGFWFVFERLSPLGLGVGVVGVLMTILMTAFEMFIQFLQAFLFAMLAAMFIASGLEGSH